MKYKNETALKKAAVEFLQLIPCCKILHTDNHALRVKGGVKVKTRNPGMSDHHICIRGLFVALEAKMPEKDLNEDQVRYKKSVLDAKGMFICYHSVDELQEEMIKLKLIKHLI